MKTVNCVFSSVFLVYIQFDMRFFCSILILFPIITLSFNCVFASEKVQDKDIPLERDYFFEGINFGEEGKELLVISKRPQSKLAEEIGYRLYSDTNLLKKMKVEFYQDYDPTVETFHFCDFDLFFYLKEGKRITFFKKINSKCDLNKLGLESISLLTDYGLKLQADTIKSFNFIKNKPSAILGTNFVFSEFVSLDGIWQDFYPKLYHSCIKPNLFYDGFFQVELNDSSSIENQINSFLSQIDLLEFKSLNYELREHKKDSLSNSSTDRKLLVYLNEDCYRYFPQFKIESNNQLHKKVVLKDQFLLVFRRD